MPNLYVMKGIKQSLWFSLDDVAQIRILSCPTSTVAEHILENSQPCLATFTITARRLFSLALPNYEFSLAVRATQSSFCRRAVILKSLSTVLRELLIQKIRSSKVEQF